MIKTEIYSKEGTMDGFLFKPSDDKIHPLVILFMDAFGPRPSLFEIADRLVTNGYSVFLPNLYFRFGIYPAFDPKTAFNTGPERERIMGMIGSLTIAAVMNDCKLWLDYLGKDQHIDLNRIGTLGYCMGGKFTLGAAAFFPANILAAASIHGGGLVTDRPDSPHLLVNQIKAKVYVGIADNDRSFTESNKIELEESFIKAGVHYTMEVYPDGQHGFAVRDMNTFNPVAAERHYDRILKLFKETL
jgi:carboxymethylenebutenolidase